MKGPAAVLQLAMLLMVVFGAAALVGRDLQGQLLAAAFGVGAIVLTGAGGARVVAPAARTGAMGATRCS